MKIRPAVYIPFACVALYAGTVAFGCAPYPKTSCQSVERSVIDCVQRWSKEKSGEYAVRRVFPSPDEWLPFQSTFIVSRDGKDVARIAYRRLPFANSSRLDYSKLPRWWERSAVEARKAEREKTGK